VIFDAHGVVGVVNSGEGAAAEVKNGGLVSVGNVVVASGPGTHGHYRYVPEVRSHVVDGIGCSRAEAVSYQVVELGLESSTRLAIEEADDLVFAGRSPDHRRESEDV